MSNTKKIGTYIGLRETVKHTLAHFWEFEDGKTPGWKKPLVVGAHPGERYEFTFDADNHVFTKGEHKPKFLGKIDDEEKIRKWVAEDRAAYQRDLERRTERKMKERQTDFQKALAPMKLLLATVKSHDDRAALINAITTELWRR